MHSNQDSPATAVPETPSQDIAANKRPKYNPISIGVLVVLGGVLAAVLAGMFFSKGGSLEERAKQALVAKVSSESGGQISVANFEKVDGQNGELAGVPTYKLTFRAWLRFQNDGTWYAGDPLNRDQLSFRFDRNKLQTGGTLAEFHNTVIGAREANSLKTEFISGVMIGEKSEKGWTFSLASAHVE